MPRSVRLHSGSRSDGDAKELGVLSSPPSILHLTHDAMLIGSGIHAFLSRSLVGSDADLFVHFCSGIPQDHLLSDVATDGITFTVKQRDATSVGRVEPII